MKYLFILGRNIELSVAELVTFLDKEKISFKVEGVVLNGCLIETKKPLGKIIDKLGGIVAIGEVLASGKNTVKELDKQQLYVGKGNKLNYTLADFDGDNFDEIQDYLKQRFREERLKATEKKLTGRIKLQTGEEVSKVYSNLIHEQYFVFKDNFGRVIEQSNAKAIEERDMKKPVRRHALSISPRLSKIMINLSGAREGETLLDPFCGIGSILQEALLQNMKVIGIDKDSEAIKGAKINLKWFGFDEKKYNLINGDSSSIKIPHVAAVATEPELGELQKGIPTYELAVKMARGFEDLMINVLRNLRKYVKGRIVFTAPLIQTKERRIECNLNRIASESGFKIAKGFPISEFRESSIVGRSILVLEK